QAGGGTRIKILEAFAHGTPVVSTSTGARGLDVVHGEHLLIADETEAIAQACERLHRRPDLAKKLREGGWALASDRFSRARIVTTACQLIAPNELIGSETSTSGGAAEV